MTASIMRRAALVPRGARLRLFPTLTDGLPAEIVTLSPLGAPVEPGPADACMAVVDAVGKAAPYDPPRAGPPWRGPVLPPVRPGPGGDFTHVEPGTRAFLAVHLYGCVRRTLDIWEGYLGETVRIGAGPNDARMELIPLLDWPNAQSGPGFLETGVWPEPGARVMPFAMNYDVVAHETGHQILFAALGVPDDGAETAEFLAFHESFADLIALIGLLHFPQAVARLLEQTGGNLYVLNLLNRFGETGVHSQIRLASNSVTMADVAGVGLSGDGTWHDPAGRRRNQHAVAEPLTGAVFDVLVELYQDQLAERGLVPPDEDARGWTRAEVRAAFSALARASSARRARFAGAFQDVLALARDAVGEAMAHVIRTLDPAALSFGAVAGRFIEGVLLAGFGKNLPALLHHFQARGIDPSPHLAFAPIARRPARLASITRRPARLASIARRPAPLAPIAAPRRLTCCRCHNGWTRTAQLVRAGHR